jgi:hypothetical protein
MRQSFESPNAREERVAEFGISPAAALPEGPFCTRLWNNTADLQVVLRFPPSRTPKTPQKSNQIVKSLHLVGTCLAGDGIHPGQAPAGQT